MSHDTNVKDIDPIETTEWLEALASVIKAEGVERAAFLLNRLAIAAEQAGIATGTEMISKDYINTIPVAEDSAYPGDEEIEKKINSINRWNAVCMVLHATKKAPELGGHLATYASSATLYAVGFNHVFQGPKAENGGDLVYFQGHASPGVYAQAFIEGRLSETQLSNFRQEIGGHGLTSYPHPWLMPDFWQFATVSMGLGPIQAIYQARFLKYLEFRNLIKTTGRKVWTFCGDGEMDEPESTGALHIASKEHLDNIIFVVNCNLQRLDGPVRGNSSIVRELENVFTGSGWEVIKVLWGSNWDKLFAKDKTGLLIKRMNECVDGEYQMFRARDGAYIREHFFGKYPELKELVADMTDEEIWKLKRGGHDATKVYAAFKRAREATRPVVILAHTVKGYGLGDVQAQNITHNQKKLTIEQLKKFRDLFHIPVSDDQIEKMPFYKPSEDSPEIRYVKACRQALGGFLPARRRESGAFETPKLEAFAAMLKGTEEREISNTMAFVRILNVIMKDKEIGKRVVPIVPDESRTFGMEGMFRQYGIYSPVGQLYEPVDKDQVMYYREAQDGQVFEEGLTEAGAFCSWLAAGTSYSVSNYPMIPFYVYYSMFGFQRVGDLAWAAGDMQARGFLIGAISGRTTLAGEGLQHQDGHSHILANTIPTCVSYDPCYSYELAVIIQHGMKRMYQDLEKIFFYITITNESYQHIDMPERVEEGILQGMYLLHKAKTKAKLKVRLLGSGVILREAEAAAELLMKDFEIQSEVWSVTSFNELGRDGLAAKRWNMLHPTKKPKLSYVEQCLKDSDEPVVAVSDYMKSYAEQIRAFVPGVYHTLGTDGFGRSDVREQLREHFEINRYYIVVAALKALADAGKLPLEKVEEAIKQYKIDAEKPNPLHA
ncbi:MAG: pyruvate dehydrogenase (acetyl-transferring), homodimeric type [Gammaproteobacteria bacterium RIFCSPHIGHO2_12_FULL_35_23]|nr:MAG: pyruvate dehydrogenase (acetyl-transferring), homodimeric type [Gammaproteobacteria bacterium RIFCSPHIGHO2_12_FULL_35_23]